jgi:hypothetical protein
MTAGVPIAAHISDTDLALYASGDQSATRALMIRWHIGKCERCRTHLEAFRADRTKVREISSEMPQNIHWDRLAAEMTANIRVGLAAGECVAPRGRKSSFGWRPAAAMAGLAAVLVTAWWLNMPRSTTQALGRAMTAVVHGHGSVAMPGIGPMDDRGMVVEASSSGIELRENGSMLGVTQGAARPLEVSLSAQGSASARYIDTDTGQITITSVYAQ